VAFSLEALKASHNVTVQWHSFELRPKGTPPLSEDYKATIAVKRQHFHQMARDHYGVEINEGPFGVDSRPALVGAKYAEAQGVGDAYHDAVFRAYWQQAKSIEDISALADIAEDIGLERDAFVVALEMEQWDSAVTADVYQAHRYGLNGVPALVFANKYLVTGAQPYEVLVQAVEQIRDEQEKMLDT
jgi:predicted DsbA family dithiol-disulfide isomerase